jgi:hypothetical protein
MEVIRVQESQDAGLHAGDQHDHHGDQRSAAVEHRNGSRLPVYLRPRRDSLFGDRALADLRRHWPERGGIFGGVTCQICGQVVTFQGLWALRAVFHCGVGAVGGWVYGRDGGRHEHTQDRIDELEVSRLRFCELCGERKRLAAFRDDGDWFICDECVDVRCEWYPVRAPHSIVAALVRRRWIRLNR